MKLIKMTLTYAYEDGKTHETSWNLEPGSNFSVSYDVEQIFKSPLECLTAQELATPEYRYISGMVVVNGKFLIKDPA